MSPALEVLEWAFLSRGHRVVWNTGLEKALVRGQGGGQRLGGMHAALPLCSVSLGHRRCPHGVRQFSLWLEQPAWGGAGWMNSVCKGGAFEGGQRSWVSPGGRHSRAGWVKKAGVQRPWEVVYRAHVWSLGEEVQSAGKFGNQSFGLRFRREWEETMFVDGLGSRFQNVL